MNPKLQLLILFWLVVVLPVSGQDQADFQKKVYAAGNGDELNYRLLAPMDFESAESYPLVIFLHGSGERGDNNKDQLIHGSSLFLDLANRKKFPAFVVFPQCPKEERWASVSNWRSGVLRMNETPGKQMELLFGLLDELKKTLPVDQSRIYLSGLSMGGFGTFDAIMRRPNEFAAAMPICGGGDTSRADVIANIPIWIFHGAEDPVVPVTLSREMNDALKKVGGNVQYTEYPGVSHDSWNNAFAEKYYLSWMFSQVRK